MTGDPSSIGTFDESKYAKFMAEDLPDNDLSRVIYETTFGNFYGFELGSTFVIKGVELEPNIAYEVWYLGKKVVSKDSVEHSITIREAGDDRLKCYKRAGSPRATIVAGGWTQVNTALIDEALVNTTGIIDTLIYTFTLLPSAAYELRYKVRAVRTDGLVLNTWWALTVKDVAGVATIEGGPSQLLGHGGEGGMMVTVVPVLNTIEFYVRGKLAQDWDWAISTQIERI